MIDVGEHRRRVCSLLYIFCFYSSYAMPYLFAAMESVSVSCSKDARGDTHVFIEIVFFGGASRVKGSVF